MTLKEFELLCLLVQNHGNVLSRDTILQQIWGYEFDGEKLREVKAKLNKDEDAYEWTSSKLTTYVVSDAKLKADGTVSGSGDKTEDDKTETNPNTGANDVVGLAAGLAVVSLVAGGAVMLKKKEN